MGVGVAAASWDRIKRFFSPPLFPDKKKTRQAIAIQASLVAYLGIAVCSFAFIPFVHIGWEYSALFLLGVIVCLVGAFVLAKRGAVKAAAFLFPLALWCALALLGLFGGGILSIAFPLLGLVILLSSLLSGSRTDVIFIPLNVMAGALFYFLAVHARLPGQIIPTSPLALWISMTVSWALIGSAVFLSRRSPLELIGGENRRNTFLIHQAAKLTQEIDQRRQAEMIAHSRASSLFAASKMAIECATAPRGTDSLKLIAEQIHAVTKAVATVVSTFDAERSELHVKHVVMKEPFRAIAEKVLGLNPLAAIVPIPPGYGVDTIRGGIFNTTDLTEITFGSVSPRAASALKRALNIGQFMGIGLVDGESILATVLVGLAPGTPLLSQEVAEIFSTVATMMLRQKRTEEVAHEQETRFTDMIDQLPQPVLELSTSGVVLFTNAAADEVFGIDSRRAEKRVRAIAMVAPEDRQRALAEFASLCAHHHQGQSRFTLIRKDGSRFPAIITAKAMMKGNVVYGVRGVVADVSSIQRAEERLRDSEQMLRLILDLMPLSIFWKDRNATYLGGNRAFASHAGLSGPDEVPGKTDDSMPWHALAESARKTESDVIETGTPQTNHEITADTTLGTNRRIKVGTFPLRNAQGQILGILGFSEDITDRVNNDATRILLGTAIEQAVESVVITDTSGAIQYVNSAFLKSYGYGYEEVIGQNPRIIKSGKDGVDFYRDLWSVVSSGKVWHGRFHNVCKDHTSVIEEAIISPVLDSSGTTTHYVKVARDVTYEVDLERRFQQSQKMEAVGRLAGGVAHDFNNILTVIAGYSEILMRRTEQDGRWKEELGAIADASARASTLTGQLLAFSRKQMLEPQVVDLNTVIRGIEKMLQRLIGEDIALATELEPSGVPVFVDKGQIEQVILNLAVNARDAMPKGGRMHLQTRRIELDQHLLDAHSGAKKGEHVVLEVSDTGTGMTEEVRTHLFEPFFTTKPEHKGTGLGLATVYGIVTQSQGFIEVDTKPGEGTRFSIFFPISVHVETAKPKSVPTEFSLGRSESILLVEDDPAIRKLLQRSLGESGFIVTVAADAATALGMFRAGSFHLLLSDVIMPDQSGPDLAESLRKLQPGLKVLFISGYTANETSEYGIWGNEINLLQKPFSMKDLVRRVRETLDSE